LGYALFGGLRALGKEKDPFGKLSGYEYGTFTISNRFRIV